LLSAVLQKVIPKELRLRKQLLQEGLAIIENFWSKSKCHSVIRQIDEAIEQLPSRVQRARPESLGGDERLFGFELVSADAYKFLNNKNLLNLGKARTGQKQTPCFTLAGRLTAVEGEARNSGGGWHKDALKPQFKALIYLTDVTLLNGPFTFIPKSNDPSTKGDLATTRFSDEMVDGLCKALGFSPKVICAPAGTCIIVDTSCLHRGAIIKSGVRYSLTNYYFSSDKGCQNMRTKVSPYLLQGQEYL
jgi:hypothetical protein